MKTHIPSDQGRTCSIVDGQRNGTLLLPASRFQRGFATWIARLLVFCLAAALVVGCGTSSAPPPSQQPPSQGAQNCAWPSMFSVQSANTAFPDSAAFYWGQPLVADQHTTIQIEGQFPDARYASLSVYTPYGNPFTTNGVSSSLPDYRIRPQPGSQNPWQQSAPPGGRFDVTISLRRDTEPGQRTPDARRHEQPVSRLPRLPRLPPGFRQLLPGATA